ncbi:MAG TPA: potassium transporter TrkG [Nonomuraea sp.]|nr:potassium transporter TrkG [Nonomuraea sp.]
MRGPWRHPARLLPVAFLAAIAVSTLLLLLPAARADPDGTTPLVVALFTAVSAVCVTGLTVVDTTFWSDAGHAIIVVSAHVGGYGIMTAATLLGLLVARRLGVRTRLLATAEGRTLNMANIRGVLLRVALIQLGFEVAVAVPITLRWWWSYGQSLPEALRNGVFHSVTAFNNAGFSRFDDSLASFGGDWWICVPLAAGVVAGSLGFPALIELGRQFLSRHRWSVHLLLTVVGSAALLVVGVVTYLAIEWTNPQTFGPMAVTDKVLAAIFNGAMPRSGGFSTVDFADMRQESITVTLALMFIGGGSASTAGGIKVTTFLLLGFVIWAEIRGEPDVVVARRRIAGAPQRQALSVTVLSVGVVTAAVLLVVALTDGFAFEHVMFDVISAFGTVGLSTGVTMQAPVPAQLVLAAMMFIGRLGPVVVATAIALNTRQRLYRYPEERPLVG